MQIKVNHLRRLIKEELQRLQEEDLKSDSEMVRAYDKARIEEPLWSAYGLHAQASEIIEKQLKNLDSIATERWMSEEDEGLESIVFRAGMDGAKSAINDELFRWLIHRDKGLKATDKKDGHRVNWDTPYGSLSKLVSGLIHDITTRTKWRLYNKVVKRLESIREKKEARIQRDRAR